MGKTIELEIFRYIPEIDEQPAYRSYEVEFEDDWVILDAINHIKDKMDGSLSYRWSCRMGVCGSCGMMINGIPKLTCATFLKDYYPKKVKVEPLLGFPVERDLVIVMDDFMTKLENVKPWMIRDKDKEKTIDKGEHIQSPVQLEKFIQFSMCINCLLCYSACPVYVVDNNFIGPAAIALAQRYNLDSRDDGQDQRNEYIGKHEGIWDCTFVGECSKVCPEDVDPAAAIQQAKVTNTQNFVKSILWPFGGKK
ncbi:succinate dehydrogenase/fumarate reductase iron-sulfur subunit [candidate division KSB1 bacterium]|nr:succinate dehydrogenase/fumarate reductase iron-sulfur subunit [candidate division KSB1 bacterium]